MTPIESLLAGAVISKTLNLTPTLATFSFVMGYTLYTEYNENNSLILYCNAVGKAMYAAAVTSCIVALLKP